MTIQAMYSISKLLQKSCSFQGASTSFSIHVLVVDLRASGLQEQWILWSFPSIGELCMTRDFWNLHSFLIVRINV